MIIMQDISPADPDLIRHSYQRYYETGAYDRRYPVANHLNMRSILAHLPPGGHVIDYGCGSGRYLFPLRGRCARATGFDVSATAISLLQSRAEVEGWDDLTVLGPDPELLERHICETGLADLALCLFGVLAHITDRSVRIETLRRIHRLLVPGKGRLLVSVPNILRRFRQEQQGAVDGLIRYSRQLGGETVTLPYQLFSARRLCDELGEAGFTVEALRAESVFSESWNARFTLLRRFDSLITPLCPARLGYGLFAVARA